MPCYPFQIPVGCLVPERVENLLPASKNLGVTHVTNGATRMHPTEWMVGEAAGALAVFSLEHQKPPRALCESADLCSQFQRVLARDLGVDLEWPTYGTHEKLLIDW